MNVPNISHKFTLKQLNGKFLFGLLACASILSSKSNWAAGSCDTYVPIQGQTVTCSPSGTTSTGVQTPANNTTVNEVTVYINAGTELNLSGSTIGLGSRSTVNNGGTLNTRSFFNGYGISFGANGRSQAGGNLVLNSLSGSIITGGGNAHGIYVSATNSGSLGNTITNNGTISTSGAGAHGIYLRSGTTSSSAINTITNSGTIAATGTGSIGILVEGAANVTNTGTIGPNGSGIAIQFENGTTRNGLSNSVTLGVGSSTNGSIYFNSSNTQETLTFSGLVNNNFSNTITNVSNINAQSGSDVLMNSLSGYSASVSNPNLTFNVDNSSRLKINSEISGSGNLIKNGAGVLSLTEINTYSGTTSINSGTLELTGSINSSTTIYTGAFLTGGGTINGSVLNAGDITPSISGSLTNLTINGNYSGQNGTFTTNVYEPTSSPLADLLIINGTVSGNTGIRVVDKGGLGLPTSGDGIKVVQSAGGSGTFALSGRAASGAYEYYLYKGDASGTGNNWYLRTENTYPPVVPVAPDPRYRIEVATYPGLPSIARMYTIQSVDTLDERRPDLVSLSSQPSNPPQAGWIRMLGRKGASTPSTIDDGPKLDFQSYGIQMGVDLYQNQDGQSRTYVGPYITIGGMGSSTFNQQNTIQTGKLSLMAYSFGMNAVHFYENGAYVDVLGQFTRFDNMRASSTENAELFTRGWGFTGSVETGLKFNLNSNWSLTPQAQITVDSIDIDPTKDAYGEIKFNKDDYARGRLGLMIANHQQSETQKIKSWFRTSVQEVFKGGTTTVFSSLYGVNDVSFQSKTGSRWLSFDTGLSAQLSKNSAAYFNLGWDTSLSNVYHSFYGKLGIQTRW